VQHFIFGHFYVINELLAGQGFSARIPQDIVMGSPRNRGMPRRSPNIPQNITAIGNTVLISMSYQLALYFV
jgi:hypothetical protein